jgi:uncharacterized protein YidB (DUF937 family)
VFFTARIPHPPEKHTMAKSPSLIALLGLLAVAGYQNRDRIGGWLDGMRSGSGTGSGGGDDPRSVPGTDTRGAPGTSAGGGSLMDHLGGLFGGNAQAGIGGALSDLVDSFTGKGRGDVARSWIESGPNRQPSAADVEDSLGSDVIDDLVEKTGLPRRELLDRLSSILPAAVDGLTPDGRLPAGAGRGFADA